MCDFLTNLSKLSSAEDFLGFLEVPYDPAVVRVNRLHILRRFRDYLETAGLPGQGLTDDGLHAAYAGWLTKAYKDFVTSDAMTEKVFPVFKQACRTGGRAFVPLEPLRR